MQCDLGTLLEGITCDTYEFVSWDNNFFFLVEKWRLTL
jgi:hypothetical protein